MTPNVGDVFQQFRILEKVGEGGMGVVFRARDTRLDRDVALKFLTRIGRLSPEHGERLRREAKSLAALNHPNNEMQRVSADPDTAARYEESCHSRGEGREIFERLRVPTLVIHCRDDQMISFEEGRRLAALISGAQLVPLPSGTHYFPTDEDVTVKVVDAIDRFTGR